MTFLQNHPVQTILLSATLSAGVETLAGMTLVNPITVDLGAESVKLNADDYKSLENEQFSLPENLQQMVCFVPLKLKFLTLFALIKKRLQSSDKTVVFFSCIEEIKFFYKVLVDASLELTDDEDDLERILALHGDMPQERRKSVYTTFKESKTCILQGGFGEISDLWENGRKPIFRVQKPVFRSKAKFSGQKLS